MKAILSPLSMVLVLISFSALADRNTTIQSFNTSKKKLLSEVYAQQSDRKTIYCDAKFNDRKDLTLPSGFSTTKFTNRLSRYETEHIVPAENFGQNFSEWREGHPECVNKKGKAFKGRRCAEKINTEYRYMQSDLYNLYPAIGAVNASRSNYNFEMLSNAKSQFGSCDMQIDSKKVLPPVRSRGAISRAYLYMDSAYPKYNMSKSQKQLMHAWDKLYPVSDFECRRAAIIQRVQGNANLIMKERCK